MHIYKSSEKDTYIQYTSTLYVFLGYLGASKSACMGPGHKEILMRN